MELRERTKVPRKSIWYDITQAEADETEVNTHTYEDQQRGRDVPRGCDGPQSGELPLAEELSCCSRAAAWPPITVESQPPQSLLPPERRTHLRTGAAQPGSFMEEWISGLTSGPVGTRA